MRCRSLKIYKRNEREGLCFQGSIQIETSIGPSCLSTSKETLFVDQHGRSKNQRRLYKSDLRFRNWTVMKIVRNTYAGGGEGKVRTLSYCKASSQKKPSMFEQ
ncbi:PREDICTED: uncharacterized protein LOC106319899 isoform X2 [Brassica oleracea var. oleracea]|uniref:uncharacterized protein LOC106319899 isoform X2 n=1 Tax=Brassica oleracea var. oleracea TaxID=109376 RepID=UPI0006A6F675|nr:PREDICTED: uncharacterized protein LOC106319899 isoform X2 [Brassica oleracea var. oleracea]